MTMRKHGKENKKILYKYTQIITASLKFSLENVLTINVKLVDCTLHGAQFNVAHYTRDMNTKIQTNLDCQHVHGIHHA